jgi:hypothetical protein
LCCRYKPFIIIFGLTTIEHGQVSRKADNSQ